MTAASATPQQMRDRLLQAIDGQSNQIHNMVAVLEVISHLEKYPITKEALEETRLGKLINDVRKKTNDEDLAKRAKKLLRNWQKLIEPGQTEGLPKGGPGTPGSANGGAHPCRTDTSPPAVSPIGKPVSELKSKNDVYNSYSAKSEKSGSRKRKGGQRDGLHSKKSIHEPIHNSSPPSTNGVGDSPEPLPSPLDTNMHPPSGRGHAEHLDNDKHSKIPVNAVKPHPSSPGLVKLPSTSSLLKTAVLQQHAKMDEGAGGGVQSQPRSPRCSSFSPKSMKQETMAKRPATYAPKGTLSSPSQSSRFLDSSTPVPSPLPSPQPLIPSVQVSHGEGPQSLEPKSSLSWHGLPEENLHLQHSTGTPEPLQDSSRTPKPASHNVCTAPLGQGFSEAAKTESDSVNPCFEGKRRKRYRPRDYTVNLVGQPTEESTKPVRLKDRRLTFDPVTGQIKPLTHKESYQGEEPLGSPPPKSQRTDLLQQNPSAPLPSPFQQTNWKELYRNEIIQSYLNIQSNVLTSSGAQTPGAHFFMTEYLKREEHYIKESRKTHVLVAESSDTDLPGVSREVTSEDLHRIHKEHWPGVNGCYDTKDNWYDWTQCISLDPHGDESKLNILPYVCLD
ncbi:mediator of RNA polymerase II transcription subunit 26-like isoform X1 [Megalops cyprinoides]|uniref:mediator of RNA polymerase II transcription subunit 26-like isoform X1 n=1 Tax=Megalops cyprinoides TaxID=118141 RepID=UPI0018643977|nr:mediator of RNA polymerase II transcription subunit 26-like isoform X1 [Megalops cyprinoides]